MRRVTFSRNFTLSLSRTCQCFCKYCAFATHRAHLYAPEEVERLLDEAARRGVKELLVLTGEKPEVNREVAARLTEYGHDGFVSYVAWACERALERGMLPHTNVGVCTREELQRLRQVTASQGLMLESVNPDLVVHQGSPTKHPERRLETIRLAGELRIPFTSGILVGIGETADERVAALEALAAVHAEHGHLQEVILQNFVPHPRYYGAEPAEIADEAQRTDTHGEALPPPPWATPVTLDDMRALVRESRRLMPDVGVQIPPNLSDWWLPLVDEGATDLGGLSANGDHISPEHPFPSVHTHAQVACAARLRAHRAALRVPAVPRRRLGRAGSARRDQVEVLELHPAAWLRPSRGAADPARPCGRRDRQGPSGHGADRGGAHGAVRRDAGPRPSRTSARQPTSCAASWRARR